MGASAALIDNAVLSVTPGGDASCEIKVRNTGVVVDEYTFEVLGAAAAWSTVEPSSLSLFPDSEGTAKVTFRPPRRPDTPSGLVPFGVKVTSNEDPGGTDVVESAVEVGPFTALMADIVPRTSHGRFAGRHRISISNRGNEHVVPLLGASDPDDLLKFDLPNELAVEPGTVGFAKVRATPRDRFLWGPSRTHPFTIVAEAKGEPPMALQANMAQDSIIPRWLPALLAVLAGLALAWFFLLKPTVESTARDAVQDPITKVNVDLAKQADTNAAQQQQLEQQAATQDKQAQQIDNTKEIAQTAAQAAPGRTFDDRLQANCGTVCAPAYSVGPKQQLSITDIVLQNPKGDTGTLTLLRNDSVLLQVALENFRDLDYHFISPWVFASGDKFSLEVACKNVAEAGASAAACTPAVSFTGTLQSTKA
jgi:hypothetical protein